VHIFKHTSWSPLLCSIWIHVHCSTQSRFLSFQITLIFARRQHCIFHTVPQSKTHIIQTSIRNVALGFTRITHSEVIWWNTCCFGFQIFFPFPLEILLQKFAQYIHHDWHCTKFLHEQKALVVQWVFSLVEMMTAKMVAIVFKCATQPTEKYLIGLWDLMRWTC